MTILHNDNYMTNTNFKNMLLPIYNICMNYVE